MNNSMMKDACGAICKTFLIAIALGVLLTVSYMKNWITIGPFSNMRYPVTDVNQRENTSLNPYWSGYYAVSPKYQRGDEHLIRGNANVHYNQSYPTQYNQSPKLYSAPENNYTYQPAHDTRNFNTPTSDYNNYNYDSGYNINETFGNGTDYYAPPGRI